MTELPVVDELHESFVELDEVVFKRYLEGLDQFPVVQNEQPLEEMVRKTRLNRIGKIVYDRDEDNLEKLGSVFSSMASHEAPIMVFLRGDEHQTQIYMGTQSLDVNKGYLAIETFERSLQAGFPGLESEELYADDIRSICKDISSPETQYITSVSGVPSLKDSESDGFVQGIEKIVEGMQGRKYMALMLATPVNREQLECAELAYQELYSSLSVMESQQLTLSESQSETLGKTMGKNLSRTISNTLSKSQSATHGRTSTSGYSSSTSTSDTVGASIIVLSASRTKSKTKSESHSESISNSKTEGRSNSVGRSNTEGSSETDSVSTTGQVGSTRQYTFKNRRITDILELMDEQLMRIRDCKNHGMWNFGTYFIGSEQSSVQIGADLLAGILCGESSGIERNAILNWSTDIMDNRDFSRICDSLARFSHPVFETSSAYSFAVASPTSLVSTKELAVGMSLPQKSLPGIPVFDSVEFGRSVSTYSNLSMERNLEVGSVFHLGRVSNHQKVEIGADSLTSHLFVTGSTGSGKSNTIYSILHDLWKKKDVPFLVIEPAKGEYKSVFGGYRGVSVFGTNAALTPLLRVNPFSFPEGIHVTEHIDRLIEILNAVWPMYAAMPAILKSGVELAYREMGWDLLASTNKYGRIFPDFQDLLEVLPSIIEGSEYSAEMKGNYTGALVTRIESMTNGYYRSIFQKDELENELLFDKPCIVDLSRVGSSETKSLLMGIVFMKLQEYRMSEAKGSNAELKHITVLEEAHNLMRRTSFDQSSDGSNLQGKAVEMISNAIAEMRTYGEGFIIADQAPGLLDQSVIRNTNTKIILRLPDWEDRELVGKAANLKDEQIEELARLRTGCAAVYQNDWQEAVLCQFDCFDEALEKPFNYELGAIADPVDIVDPRLLYRTKLIEFYLRQNNPDINVDLPEWLERAKPYYPRCVSLVEKNEILDSDDFKQLIRFDVLLDYIPETEFYDVWLKGLLSLVFGQIRIESLSEEMNEVLVERVLDCLIALKPEQECWKIERERSSLWCKGIV